MSASLSNLYFRNPRLLLLTVALVAVAGLSAWRLLPRMEDPIITSRFANVTTPFPGASAERVEALVTEKLEDELRDIEEVKLVRSTSRAGISNIELELADSIVEVDEVWSRARDAVADATSELPAGAGAPEFEEAEPEAFALIVALVWESDLPVQHGILRRLARELEDRLALLPGTRETESFGAPEEEIQVELRPEDLAALDATAEEIAGLVADSDAKVGAGQMRGRAERLSIEVADELDSLERIRRIPVRTGAGGSVTRLGDFARVQRSVESPRIEVTLVGGRDAVAVGVLMESDQRVDLWAADARELLAEVAAELPRGIALETVFDQSRYTETRLQSLLANLGLGALLVVLVVLLLMGWRSALLVGVSLPLASLMVLAGMRFLDVPLHQMSITGLIIALGLLIDNAIVTVDEVRERLGAGASPADAVAASVRHLAVPLGGSTLTTVFAFMPLVLMPGPAGEFVGTIAVSVILAIVSSLFLALTVVASLAGRFDGGGSSRSLLEHGWRSPRLTAVYERFLGVVLARPIAGILLALAVPMAGFVAGSRLEEQFFPPADRDQFQLQVQLPAQTNIAETERVALAMRERLLAHDEVESVSWFLGRSAPLFYYNLQRGRERSPEFAQALVQLRSSERGSALIAEIQAELDAAFPMAQSLALQLEQGPPFDAPVELRIYGPDLDVLRQLGERARGELAAVPDVTHTRSELSEARPKLHLVVDEERARLAGLTRGEIAQQLDLALEGATGGSILEETEELPVRVRLAGSARDATQAIHSLDLAGRSERPVPLSAVAELDLVPDSAGIARRDRRRTNTVQGFLTAGVLPETALAEFRERLVPLREELPPGYRFEFGGEAAERDEAVANLAASVGLLLVLMATALVLSFQSFTLAGLIGIVGVASIGLGLAALWVSGFPFGFMAIVGTMGLVGIAINDSIVVLAALREDTASRDGDPLAVRRVVVRSTRHVVATTVTTAAGFLPLLLAGGGFWPPLAVAIAGGVCGATLLALTFVPSAWVLVRRRRKSNTDGTRPARVVAAIGSAS